MKQNMGKLDKMARLIVAIVIALLYYFNVISGTLAIVLGLLALVFALTSFVGYCPLYSPFGINTNKNEQ